MPGNAFIDVVIEAMTCCCPPDCVTGFCENGDACPCDACHWPLNVDPNNTDTGAPPVPI